MKKKALDLAQVKQKREIKDSRPQDRFTYRIKQEKDGLSALASAYLLSHSLECPIDCCRTFYLAYPLLISFPAVIARDYHTKKNHHR